jgi:phosphatidylglycerophosphatase A
VLIIDVIDMNSKFKSLQLSKSAFKKKIIILIAGGFGLGCSPVASGTAGALLGIVLVLGIGQLSVIWQIIVAALLCLAAVPVCDIAEKHFNTKDDSRIVADEYLTFPLCMIGLPVTLPVLIMAFIVNRIMDIIKPFPANKFQELSGGLGITADDVTSSLYSLALNHFLFWTILPILL